MKGYPHTRTLTNRLRQMLSGGGSRRNGFEIIDRFLQPCRSSFPSEIVTCHLDDGRLTVLCKYSRPQRCQLPAWHAAYGHRQGLSYEAWVYRHVLEPLDMATPRLCGTYEGRGGRTWMALEYLGDCMRLNSAPPGPEAAATWIGRFHALNETRLSEPALRFLTVYAADYYRGWARRTLASARRIRGNYQQIGPLSEAYEQAIEILLEPPLTIVHGEYYPSNVLWRPNSVHPVDWESAAIAAGEIDLASLTEHWSPAFVERCEAAYVRARWPAGCDRSAFARRLSAARLYMLLRWAGRPGAWKVREDRSYYLNRISEALDRFNEHRAGKRMPLAAS
jgi:hypothetical protein